MKKNDKKEDVIELILNILSFSKLFIGLDGICFLYNGFVLFENSMLVEVAA